MTRRPTADPDRAVPLRPQRRALPDGARLVQPPRRRPGRRLVRRLRARRRGQPVRGRWPWPRSASTSPTSSPSPGPTRSSGPPTSSSPWAAATPARSSPASATRTGSSTTPPARRRGRPPHPRRDRAAGPEPARVARRRPHDADALARYGGRMRRAVWTEDGLEVVDDEPGPLEPGWVRLRVEACGICGSDLHFWHGHLRRPLGTSPGHELAGTVVDGPAGPGRRALRRVAERHLRRLRLLPQRAHQPVRPRRARASGSGATAAWPSWSTRRSRTWRRSPTASTPSPRRSPSRSPSPSAASGWPACEPDDRVLVLGAGTIGLCAALVARDRAAEVAITARHPHQRAAAERLGVTVLGEDEAVDLGQGAPARGGHRERRRHGRHAHRRRSGWSAAAAAS